MTTTSDHTQPDPPADRPPAPERPADPAPAPSAWATLRPIVLRIHFYAGILVAPFLAVLCLTGLAYVFSPRLNDLVHSHELLTGPHTGTPACSTSR